MKIIIIYEINHVKGPNKNHKHYIWIWFARELLTRHFTNLQALQLPSYSRILPSVKSFQMFLSIINYFFSFNVNIL